MEQPLPFWAMSVGSGGSCGIVMWSNGVHIFHHQIELRMQVVTKLWNDNFFSLCCSLIWHFLCDLWVFFKLSKVWSLVTNCAHCNVRHVLKNCKMKVSKSLEHTNCTTRLLHLDSGFDSTLLPLKFISEDDIDWNLNGITNGNALSWLQLNLKKTSRTLFFKHFTLFVESMVFT